MRIFSQTVLVIFALFLTSVSWGQPLLPAPGNPKVMLGSDGRVIMKFSSVSGVLKYKVSRATGSSQNSFSLFAWVNPDMANPENQLFWGRQYFKKDTPYYFKISTINAEKKEGHESSVVGPITTDKNNSPGSAVLSLLNEDGSVFSGSSFEFSPIEVGGPTQAKRFLIKNTGALDATLIKVAGAQGPLRASTCSSLAAGASCSLDLQLSAAEPSSIRRKLTISFNNGISWAEPVQTLSLDVAGQVTSPPGTNWILTPSSGPVGTRVTLTGKKIESPIRILFSSFSERDSQVTTRIVSQDSEKIVFEVPPCAKTGLVTVVAGGTTSKTTIPFQITNPVYCELLSAVEKNPLVFSGTPEEKGKQQGEVFKEEIGKMTADFLGPILEWGIEEGVVPGEWETNLRENARKLEENLPSEIVDEMKAIASSSNRSYEDILLANMMEDVLLISYKKTACSTFVAMPLRAQLGAMILGRNLDFIGADTLSQLWTPVIFKSKDKLAVLSLTVPGLAGVAHGINEKGVSISHNTSYMLDEPPTTNGVASMVIIRKVLEEARTAREAAALYAKLKRAASSNITITDGKEAFVLEAAPITSQIVSPANNVLFSANHFVHPKMKNELGKEDWRWQVFSPFASTEKNATDYKMGIKDVRKIIENTGVTDINTVAFLLDYKSKRFYYGTNPDKAIRGELKYIDLTNFLK